MWNRQPSQAVLVDPANTGLGHKQVQRWNLPEGWVISRHPAHAALVSEADFIAAQDTTAPRGPAGPAVRRYLLAALSILLAGSAGISGPESSGSAQVTGPADGAMLIDRLRADGVVLTYDPDHRTLRTGGHDAPPVVIGKDATGAHSRHGWERGTA